MGMLTEGGDCDGNVWEGSGMGMSAVGGDCDGNDDSGRRLEWE